MNDSSMGPRTRKQLSESLATKLSSYALAAGATAAGMLGMIHPAEAEVVFTPTNDLFPPDYFDVVDLNHDGTPDFRFDLYSVQYRNFYVGLVAFPRGPNAMMVSAGNYVSVLSKGAAIGPHQVFAREDVFHFAVSVGFDGTTPLLLLSRVENIARKNRTPIPQDISGRGGACRTNMLEQHSPSGLRFTMAGSGSRLHRNSIASL